MRIRTFRAGTVFSLVLLMSFTPFSNAQTPAPVENVSSLPHRSPEDEKKALHVPPGFEIQLVAAEPDIHKPLNLAFDDRGRLWITDTLEYPYPVTDGSKPRDTVKILSDFGPDGRARSIETFADGLNIPIGLLPLPAANAALVHNIPDIYLMTDTDGDGKADSREPLYGVFGSRDTHGMTNAFTWGFDGWIYACHGFANDSTVQGKDQKPIKMNSGNTYRMRADGSHAEYVTHGQVNPFGLAFDSLGNLYSCDCHSRPVYQLVRGAFYPSFGKPDDGLGFGPDMVTHDHGSTGIGGISFYTANQFPEAYRGTVFLGNVVTNRVNHDKIEWHGTTPQGIEQPDFVWSEDNWFRPVDIELGPDGALYIADFYNRIIGHYEVPLTHPGRDRSSGRIWRVVYKGEGAGALASPDQIDRTKSTSDELVNDLASPTLPVRVTAANQLVTRVGKAAEPALLAVLEGPNAGPDARSMAAWVLYRIGSLDDDRFQKIAAATTDPTLLVHLMGIVREKEALTPAIHAIAIAATKDHSPLVQRAAAEALGAHPNASNVRPLLTLRQAAPEEDTHLIHVVRIALRDQLKPSEVWPTLEAADLTERDRRDLADVAPGVPTPEAAAFLLKHIKTIKEPDHLLTKYVHHIARYAEPGLLGELTGLIGAGDRDVPSRLALLKAVQQGSEERGTPLPADAGEMAIAISRDLLGSKNNDQVGLGIETAKDFKFGQLIPELKQIATREDLPESRRGDALYAIAAIDPAKGLELLGNLLNESAGPISLREAAAITLASLDRPEAKSIVLAALPAAPDRLQSTIAAALARHPEGAKALLQEIEAGKASARILQERRVVIGLENAQIPDLKEKIASLLQGLPPADEKLKELLGSRREAFLRQPHDESKGAAVFEKNCAICHQLGGKGARVGPQLDGIGSRGVDRLLEDVLDPNRNVDQSFRTTNLGLENGQIVTGLLLREEGEILVIADSQGKEVRVPKSSVEERSTAQISPMPANLAEQISEQEFGDLLTFLLKHREEKAPK